MRDILYRSTPTPQIVVDAVDDDAHAIQQTLSHVVGVLYNDGKYTGTITNAPGARSANAPGARNGSGEMKYSNGGVYYGQWKEDYRHGKGKMKYLNGDVYDGQWEEDYRHGIGEMKYSNGNVYYGKWEKNNRDIGRMTFLGGTDKVTFDAVPYEDDFRGTIRFYIVCEKESETRVRITFSPILAKATNIVNILVNKLDLKNISPQQYMFDIGNKELTHIKEQLETMEKIDTVKIPPWSSGDGPVVTFEVSLTV